MSRGVGVYSDVDLDGESASCSSTVRTVLVDESDREDSPGDEIGQLELGRGFAPRREWKREAGWSSGREVLRAPIAAVFMRSP
jgi:hypothetical protein